MTATVELQEDLQRISKVFNKYSHYNLTVTERKGVGYVIRSVYYDTQKPLLIEILLRKRICKIKAKTRTGVEYNIRIPRADVVSHLNLVLREIPTVSYS